MGKCLRQLDVKPEDVIISNKLGWVRNPYKLLEFISEMDRKGVYVIHSAVFHTDFLLGSIEIKGIDRC